MILFNERPDFETAWAATTFRVVMAGMGDDTTMVLAEMYKRGFEPDEIVFADTGSEHKHTYQFIEHLRQWCAERNWSKVVVLSKVDKQGNPLSVIETAERDNTRPGAAFGIKSCTMRFKTETADKYFNNHPGCWAAWGCLVKAAPSVRIPGQSFASSASTLTRHTASRTGSRRISGARCSLSLTGASVSESLRPSRRSVCTTRARVAAYAARI